MSELLDFYQQQAKAGLSAIPWLARLQEDALADFTRLGFPARHHEDWKYTAVDAFVQQRFTAAQIAKHDELAVSLDLDSHRFGDDQLEASKKIALINGKVVGTEALAASLPKGVIVQPLTDALLTHADKIKSYLGHTWKHEHGFHALNTAMLQGGLFIYVPQGICLDEPILISHWQDKENQAVYLRHIVISDTGSRVSLVEDFQGDAACSYFTNIVTEIHASAHSTVNHYKIQRESKLAYHIGHLTVKQHTGSQVNSHSFSLGGKLVRSDTTIRLSEPHAHCLMNGIYAPADGQHIDHHTLVTHEVPDCMSEQDYKGILTGRSRAVFNGKVVVAKGAQHTSAKQQNKNLLLSVDSEIDTKPQLEIFADDVICTHGATVGQLDEDALFYMATRGIGHAEASQFLTQAFAAENLRAIANPAISDWLDQLLNKQLR